MLSARLRWVAHRLVRLEWVEALGYVQGRRPWLTLALVAAVTAVFAVFAVRLTLDTRVGLLLRLAEIEKVKSDVDDLRALQSLPVLYTLFVGSGGVAIFLYSARVRLNFHNFAALPIAFGIGVDHAVNVAQAGVPSARTLRVWRA